MHCVGATPGTYLGGPPPGVCSEVAPGIISIGVTLRACLGAVPGSSLGALSADSRLTLRIAQASKA